MATADPWRPAEGVGEDDGAEAGGDPGTESGRSILLALAQVSVGVPSDQAFPCLHFNDIQQSGEPCFVI